MSTPPRRLRDRLASLVASAMTLWPAFAGLLLLVALSAPARAVDESDLLPVDQAFALSAEAVSPNEVRVRWIIAEGYYLYRHRTSVQPVDPDVRAGVLRLPRGEPHQDEFFGATETYRKELTATLPDVSVAGGASSGTLSLKVKYQGCADLGVCYPPQTRTLSVKLPASGTDADADAGERNVLSALGRNLGGMPVGDGGKAAPLPEEQAFGFEAIADGGNALLLRFTPARGYYLYRDRTGLNLDADGIALGKPQWPKGVPYRDEHFGQVIVYFDRIDVHVPLIRRNAAAQTVALRARFQGCQDNGICYPPMTRSVRIALPAGILTSAAAATAAREGSAAESASPTRSTQNTGVEASPPAPPASESDEDTTAATVAPAVDTATAQGPPAGGDHGVPDEPTGGGVPSNFAVALLFALLGGLILNLMPCVLPVLSMKVLGLIESGESPQRARAHALWYTAGVVLGFLALGASVLALRHFAVSLGWGTQMQQGQGWGFQMQQPLVIASLALVMFVFGLSLSGVWQVGGRWTGVGHSLAGRSGPVGDFFTGALAVVVAAPCTAPFMGPALGWAFTASAAAALPVFAMLGLGLALPFLAVGFMPSLAKRLPKPGAWMETFKQLLAFPLYLSAGWLVWVLTKQRGADAFGWWAIAAVALALGAWAWTHARMREARWSKILAFAALMVAFWPLWSIAHLPRIKTTAPPRAAQAATAAISVPFSEQRLADLRAANQVVLVNMTADWCITCKVNEKAVFAREGFRDALGAADAVYMVGDWTEVDPAITAYLRRYKAVGVPLYVVYPRGGGEGRVLPTVLTPRLVRDALDQAAQPQTK